MTLGEALEIVYSLAEQNAVDNERLGREDEALAAEAIKQQEALKIVEDFIVNEFGEEGTHHYTVNRPGCAAFRPGLEER